ncbi:type IV conjugative transfer system lipoprotein TraV [Hydrogenovibrio marinus]|uniref:Conjugal transfer protein TraV n=1 Tax=Hydrogenovibrio marinus TaxID=28885 RepID=A0A066ZWL8_HYDMR|nr:type IV conjugative transfer system lipoprotein TraV [Hydrogenovibrio marinus]KDN94726.1 hypothetical protein EI16_12585 [Hydrogenovibrio marinus]
MKKALLGILSVSALSVLSGCASISGYENAKNTFSCKAPEGVSCTSVSGTYANAEADNLPSQQVGKDRKKVQSSSNNDDSVYDEDDILALSNPKPKKKIVVHKGQLSNKVTGIAPETGKPVYNDPKVMRIWFAPWEDRDKVLHDQSFVYVVIQKGRWNLEHLSKDMVTDSRISIHTEPTR